MRELAGAVGGGGPLRRKVKLLFRLASHLATKKCTSSGIVATLLMQDAGGDFQCMSSLLEHSVSARSTSKARRKTNRDSLVAQGAKILLVSSGSSLPRKHIPVPSSQSLGEMMKTTGYKTGKARGRPCSVRYRVDRRTYKHEHCDHL